jgi:glycerol-3-phosphate dehydrogenase (NAD(P)+)
MKDTRICVLGDGGWGTTLALLLHKKGFSVTLWGAFPEYISYLNRKKENSRFLPGVKIPASIEITPDLEKAVRQKKLIVLAIPSQYLRNILIRLKKTDYPGQATYLSVIKGIEIKTLKRMSQVIRDELGNVKLAVLSGPTIAQEVVRGIPSTAVIAAEEMPLRKHLQKIFMTDKFRVYTNNDMIGVELGGSLKNIIAIACGISDGLRFGANTKAAILARGLAEISRLGQAMGANLHTFSGISGLGDLVTTCISPYSRNRYVGEQIGKGKTLKYIQSHLKMIAEGIPTTNSAYALSLRYKVGMPITNEVFAVLYKNKSPQKAVRDLMTRKSKEE